MQKNIKWGDEIDVKGIYLMYDMSADKKKFVESLLSV